MPPHILVVGFLIPIFCLVIASAIPTAGAIDCFKCVSMNGTNAACDDPFHNNHSLDILESPCMGGRKGRDGLFPATSCIKIAGVYDDTGERITVRGCALDSGTLTTDTEIIRMSHCGRFYYDDRYVHGCLQSCSDSDACNSGNSITGNHRHFHWIRGLFTSANLAAFLSLLYSLLADVGDNCCFFRRKIVTGRRRVREGGINGHRKGEGNSTARGDRIDGVREIADSVKTRRRIRETETNGKSEKSESIAVESRRGNCGTREESGKKNDKIRIEEGGRKMKGEESVVNKVRKTSTRENAVEMEQRRTVEGKDGINERISSSIKDVKDVKEGGFGGRISDKGKEIGIISIIDGYVNKKEFDEADDNRNEKNTISMSGKVDHVNNCNRGVNKEVTGKERRDLQYIDKRKLNILSYDGTGEETNERYEKRGSVNKGKAMLEGDSIEVGGDEEKKFSLERKGNGTISVVETSHTNTGEMKVYCIFERCTDVNISELKKICSFLEVRDNCNNFCKGLTNVTDFHVNSCKVPTSCPGIHNDSSYVSTNCPDINNDTCKVLTNYPGIHNDSCKVPINCPGIHNDSCKVPINCPGIHNDSCKVPINCPGIHNDSSKVSTNCPGIHNDSSKIPINYPGIHNDPCKVLINYPGIHNDPCNFPINYPGIHNDSSKASINCPGIHNDSCNVPTNWPGIHNDSCKFPTNCGGFEDYHIKKNCPQLRLSPASLS